MAKNTRYDFRAAQKRRDEEAKKVKARLVRAIPSMEGKDETYTVGGIKSTWEFTLYFKTHAQASRFCDVASDLGHEAKMRTRARWTRAYGGSTNGYHKTSREVLVRLDPAKRKAEPKPAPFDPKTVKVYLSVPLKREDVLREIAKFSVGERIQRWMNGEKVDDAVTASKREREKFLSVERDEIVLDCPFAIVCMQWDAEERAWYLSFSQKGMGGGNSEYQKRTNVALWKALCTAWNVGIRGIIV